MLITNDSFRVPREESCFDYLMWCYGMISKEVGEYPAFVNAGRTVYLKEFINSVEKLSSYLLNAGFKPGDVFTVLLPTTADAIIAFYALSRAGMVANIVHPLTPCDGMVKIQKETKSKGIFIGDYAMPAYKEITDAYFTVPCSLADFGTAWEKVPASTDGFVHMSDIMKANVEIAPKQVVDYHEPAIYMHGSGTTGIPKVVMLSAWAFNWSVYSQFVVDNYHDYGKSFGLSVLPLFHAFGLSTCHHSMCKSYAPIFMPKFDAEKANDIIAAYNVQYVTGAPSMFQKMVYAPNFVNEGIKNLNVMYSGGDIVPENIVRDIDVKLAAAGSKAKLFRGWGLTEMCACCTTNRHNITKPESIGRPFTGMDVVAMDENRNVLPPNEVGELVLTGNMMMNGYLNGDTSAFYTDKNGRKWICSGDMGYVDEDGFIFFTGRKKRIIIISGYNVYPYEIEQAVNNLPYIREACAVQGYDENAKPYVKLCVSLNETELTQEEITEKVIDFCKSKFYKYSVPRKVVFMDELPRTKMAKIDFMAMSDKVPGSKS